MALAESFDSATRSNAIAGVDLGSNSFHLVVGTHDQGRVQITDRIKETIRLAGGLDEQRRLSADAAERALQCLRRFGQRLSGIPSSHVRAVGTNTLRQARNSAGFLAQARKALGHPVEVISGQEEARLIYAGVSHSVFDDAPRRLVIDIGGGSTEFIIGDGYNPVRLDSLYMGCVGFSHRFFPDGKVSQKRFREAVLAARHELETIETDYRALGWNAAIGSSGTILALNDLSADQYAGITLADLKSIRKQMLGVKTTTRFGVFGVTPDRAPVLPGGLAILTGAFESLGIERLGVSSGALREGLLYDIVDRINRRDIRDETILQLMRQYRIDAEHADRVTETARTLLPQVAVRWTLDAETDSKLLEWAARLHEIGRFVSHSQYHKHGEYLTRHHDMRGFSRQEQSTLAALIRGHRQKYPVQVIDALPAEHRDRVRRLCVLLRLAVIINRSRTAMVIEGLTLSATASALRLKFPPNWLDQHPLTEADLDEEKAYLKAAGIRLRYE